MNIKPFTIYSVGTVFVLYGKDKQLIIADRDRAAVEKELAEIKDDKLERWADNEDPIIDDIDKPKKAVNFNKLRKAAWDLQIPNANSLTRKKLEAALKERGVRVDV